MDKCDRNRQSDPSKGFVDIGKVLNGRYLDNIKVTKYQSTITLKRKDVPSQLFIPTDGMDTYQTNHS